MTKAEQKRFDAMEKALKVIWRLSKDHFDSEIMRKMQLRDITRKCLEALGREKK